MKDRSKYLFQGKKYHKNRLVLAIVKKYLKDNPNTSYEKLVKVFPEKLQGSLGVVRRIEEIKRPERYFMSNLFKISDYVDIAVCNQWGNMRKYGKIKQDVDNFIDHVKETLGYEITKEIS